jgi:hypothetical protein
MNLLGIPSVCPGHNYGGPVGWREGLLPLLQQVPEPSKFPLGPRPPPMTLQRDLGMKRNENTIQLSFPLRVIWRFSGNVSPK